MPSVTSQRMGVCCECQSQAPVRLNNQARAYSFEADHVDFPPAHKYLMEPHRVGGGEVGEPCNGVATVPQALVYSPYEHLSGKVRGFSEDELTTTWFNLAKTSWTNADFYDEGSGITMNSWAQLLESEMNMRCLPTER